jgi:hypothetical protein
MKAILSCATYTMLMMSAAFFCSPAPAEDGKFDLPPETQLDLNSGFVKKYKEMMQDLKHTTRRFFKFDLDADINHDGAINDDDSGWLEDTPPGLVIMNGTGATARLRLTSSFPYFPGRAALTLDLRGINRASDTGEFGSFEEEVKSTGHVIVWADNTKKKKLLDTMDPNKRVIRWFLEPGAVLPGKVGVPESIYIEATGISGKYAGDIRLMSSVEPAPEADGKEPEIKFLPAFDHLLITVVPK